MKKLIIITALLFITFFNTTVSAFIYNNTYPYPSANHCGCEADPWGFFKRQCTSYAAWKVNESGISMTNWMTGPNGNSGLFGNAGTWDDNAAYIGFAVDTLPRVGDIAVWEARPGYPYYMDVGHVARVEEVNGSTVYVSEYNWNYGNGLYNERTPNLTPDHYIHFGGGGLSCGGANVIISNQTITGSVQCSATSSIKIESSTQILPGSGVVRFYIQ